MWKGFDSRFCQLSLRDEETRPIQQTKQHDSNENESNNTIPTNESNKTIPTNESNNALRNAQPTPSTSTTSPPKPFKPFVPPVQAQPHAQDDEVPNQDLASFLQSRNKVKRKAKDVAASLSALSSPPIFYNDFESSETHEEPSTKMKVKKVGTLILRYPMA